jgi:hypothetical protein
LSAFFTTAFAAINVYAYAEGWTGWLDLVAFKFRWSELLGLATALVSGVAAAVSYLDANQTPQKRWFRARAQAEALRSLYFLYLARQQPFNTRSTGDRVQVMRQRVIEVLRQTRTGTTDQSASYLDSSPLEGEETEGGDEPQTEQPAAADRDTPAAPAPDRDKPTPSSGA